MVRKICVVVTARPSYSRIRSVLEAIQAHPSLELQLVVSWDLGDIAYHPESIDVSHEAREIIELRDDVLDEITQLYFERRRVLAALALQPDALVAGELQLRAAQLAAGIDAWTGGWFGRQLANSTP